MTLATAPLRIASVLAAILVVLAALAGLLEAHRASAQETVALGGVLQNGTPVVDAGCSLANTDVAGSGSVCSGAVDVFDVLAFVNVAFQNGSISQFCDPCP